MGMRSHVKDCSLHVQLCQGLQVMQVHDPAIRQRCFDQSVKLKAWLGTASVMSYESWRRDAGTNRSSGLLSAIAYTGAAKYRGTYLPP